MEPRERPLGVWILTIWIGLNAGILAPALVIQVYSNPVAREVIGLTTSAFLVNVLLGLGILLSAIFTWKGDRRALYVFMCLTALHYLMLAYSNYNIANLEGIPDGSTRIATLRAIRSVATLIVVIWYFWASERTDDFFSTREPVVPESDER